MGDRVLVAYLVNFAILLELWNVQQLRYFAKLIFPANGMVIADASLIRTHNELVIKRSLPLETPC